MPLAKCGTCGKPKVQYPICPECKLPVIPADHPGWMTVRFLALMGLLTIMLYGNATNFDETELRVLGGVAAFAGPAMFGNKIIEVVRKAVN